MNARIWIVLAVFCALFSGCGNQDPQPRATDTQANPWDSMAGDAKSAAEREAQRLHDDMERMAAEVKTSVKKTQGNLESEARRKRDEMAEFAAQMAEDAKDRALDIPDVLDEFFGSPTSDRRWGAGDRSERPSRRQ